MRFLIVVPDIADGRAHRPADHAVGRVGGEQRLHMRLFGRVLAEPFRTPAALFPMPSALALILEKPSLISLSRTAPGPGASRRGCAGGPSCHTARMGDGGARAQAASTRAAP
jgi:hypothetical protein